MVRPDIRKVKAPFGLHALQGNSATACPARCYFFASFFAKSPVYAGVARECRGRGRPDGEWVTVAGEMATLSLPVGHLALPQQLVVHHAVSPRKQGEMANRPQARRPAQSRLWLWQRT